MAQPLLSPQHQSLNPTSHLTHWSVAHHECLSPQASPSLRPHPVIYRPVRSRQLQRPDPRRRRAGQRQPAGHRGGDRQPWPGAHPRRKPGAGGCDLVQAIARHRPGRPDSRPQQSAAVAEPTCIVGLRLHVGGAPHQPARPQWRPGAGAGQRQAPPQQRAAEQRHLPQLRLAAGGSGHDPHRPGGSRGSAARWRLGPVRLGCDRRRGQRGTQADRPRRQPVHQLRPEL